MEHISTRGVASLDIFSGIETRNNGPNFYQGKILGGACLPFVRFIYSNHHRLIQDSPTSLACCLCSSLILLSLLQLQRVVQLPEVGVNTLFTAAPFDCHMPISQLVVVEAYSFTITNLLWSLVLPGIFDCPLQFLSCTPQNIKI